MGKHLLQLFHSVAGKRSYCLVLSGVDADDAAVAQVAIVTDDRLKEFGIFIEHLAT
ncbi:hypothetical protein [Mesorhizobium sp. ORM16]|uniref:hypothetical protein n=1 Tax=Mesorhizobium sp. ORM16 TaxID=3376989 RepID=UPI003857A72C